MELNDYFVGKGWVKAQELKQAETFLEHIRTGA